MMLRCTVPTAISKEPRAYARPCRNRVVLMSAHSHGRGGGPSRERRMFDKVIKDGDATFNPEKDGPMFFRAVHCQEFKSDPVVLLYRLVKAQEHGLRRLKSALSICDSAAPIRAYLLPFLELLACDALGRGTCKGPLVQVLQAVYEVPGLLGCVVDTLQRASRSAPSMLGDVDPLGWFGLRLALDVQGARADPLLPQLAVALKPYKGGAAVAADQLEVLLAPQAAAEEGSAASSSSRGGELAAAVRMAKQVVGLQDLRQYAGGRHDNDKVDYRDIKIMVTSQEALCPEPPFLPASTDDHPTLSSQPEAALLDRQFRLLRQDMVGPLREELHNLGITGPPSNPAATDAAGAAGSSAQASSSTPAAGHAVAASAESLAAAGASRNVFRQPAVLGTCLRPRPCIMFSVQLPSSHKATRLRTQAERKEFWSSFGHSTLPMDALVCLVTPGRPLLFATVARRDPAEMAHEQPIIGLSFDQEQDAEKVLAHMACGPLPHGTVLVQVSTNYLSSKPVLKCLQQMPGVPLAQELVSGKHPKPTEYLDASRSALELELEQLAPTLDPSQLTAMRQALASRVALIQGPPGTGKTFTGVKLCDLILRHSSETILCVCYTNHALDQFLEALLDKGITQIVRIGSRSKSQRLEPYNLRQLAMAGSSGYNSAESRRMFDLHRELEDLKEEVQQLSRVLVATGSVATQPPPPPPPPPPANGSRKGANGGKGPSVQQRPQPPDAAASGLQAWLQREQKLQEEEQQARQKRQAAAAARKGQSSSMDEEEQPGEWQFNEWRDAIQPFLEEEVPEVLGQLTVPVGMTRTGPSYLWWRWLNGYWDKGSVDAFEGKAAAKASGGWQQAKPGKKATTSSGSGSASSATPRPPLPPAVASAMAALAKGAAVDFDDEELLADIWTFPRALRHALAANWRGQLRGRWAEELQGVLQKAQRVLQEIRDLRDSGCEPLLANARVIGCTTTGAAQHKELLTSSKVAPRVVMIEEAGELLEAHVLTSLSPATRHLIMIGDHKQLRPKVEHYPLSVASGGNYGLDVSLFERLVLGGTPHTTLAVQHRMHPDISRLIRHTYPLLKDHASVDSRPALKGVAGRVVFMDHTQPELAESQRAAGKWRAKAAGAEHQSKVNMHEVGLSVATVKFLLQQGYDPGQMVVLTPYLGQLLELQRELSKTVEVVLADMDMQELRKAALPAALEDLKAAATGKTSSTSTSTSSSSKPGSGGVRVATVDNFQGEEADVVVVSLVRSNSTGSVGFLREPERINVLLSRARCGLIMVGNATMLRNASSHAARHHWGVVLDKLQAAGAILPGLPAVCQQHGRSLPLLDSVEAFEEYSPQGGCQEACQELLPCGHPCKLRCHAYDPGHVNQRCVEQVLTTCSAGHVTMGPCHKSKDSCSVCWEIQKVVEEERRQQEKLEAEEQRKHNQLEVQRGKLAAEEERVQKQLRALQEQMATRKEIVQKELAAAKAKKQLELEKRAAADDLATWEDQARKQAAAELEQMEQDANLQANIDAEAKKLAKKLRKQQLEEEARLRAVQRKLEELEVEGQKELQDIENRRRRAAAEADTKAATVEAGARLNSQQILQAAKVQVQLQQLCREGSSGLPKFQAWMLQAAGVEPASSTTSGADLSTAAAADVADALDVALGLPQLGKQLLSYVATQQGSVPPPPPLPATARRGLDAMGKGDWVKAMQVLEASSENSASNLSATDQAAVQALRAICQGYLQLPVTAKEGLASNSPATAFRLPGMKTKASGTPRGPISSPLQHLAAAINYSNLAASAANTKSSMTSAQLSIKLKLSAQAAGEALAYLLHPASTSSSHSAGLVQRAADILQQQGAAAFASSTAEAITAAGVGASGGDKEDWAERAGSSKALRELAAMVGLEGVKRAMCDLADEVALNKERRVPLNSRNYSCRFYGNPGTGKTTVARLYARMLEELGVLPKSAVEETSGAKLVSAGLTGIKDALKKLDEGGVLFIDEAYQLDPEKNPMGAQVLDYLLPEMENRRGKLVVVLAGYKKPMEERVMAYNEGLPSRFPVTFTFTDYTDTQLFEIMMGPGTPLHTGTTKFELEDVKYARIAASRLGRQRDSGAPGFGNARSVRNLLEGAISRQSARVIKERKAGLVVDLLRITRDDLLGPKELDTSGSQPLQQLAALRGLGAVKASVSNLLGLIRTNAELEEQERPLKEVCLNRVFLGNPGTGKTTVANIYGRVLRDLGLLSKGDVVVKVPADFIGSVLGESEQRTLAILEESRGCVLVIDEAYGLHSTNKAVDPFKVAVIDTIVAKVQGVPGDDRAVLLLGYPDQMEAMMREANPGLARRFQLSQAWSFEDYSQEDLMAILKEAAAKKYGWQLGWPELQAALKTLDQERRRPNFGNAGAVNNLLSVAAGRMEARTKHLSTRDRAAAPPAPVDFMTEADAANAAAAAAGKGDGSEAIFADLIGCQAVLDKLKEWQATIKASQALGKDPLSSFELNFTFVGSPGTGKTTVARRVGQLFCSLGLLADDTVVECSAGDFVTGYANQSAGKTREMFQKALGGVLFIDEAYRLNPKHGGPYMGEVLDEICQILTDKQFQGKMVVVLAGYEHQIEELLAVNPGLKSRFSERLVFPDFSVEDAIQLLRLQLTKEGLELGSDAQAALPGLMKKLVAAPGWSNGRDVGTWAKRIFRAYALRLQEGSQGSASQVAEGAPVTAQDLEASLADFLDSKKSAPPASSSSGSSHNFWGGQPLAPPPQQQQDAPAPAAVDTGITVPLAVSTDTAVAVEEEEVEEKEPPATTAPPGGFGGLSKEFLSNMQDALEILGYDLSSADIMQQLAADPDLADKLLPLLKGPSAAVVLGWVHQWQKAIEEQLELERELAKKKQRPVWRCAVCERYGCPVAPCIERYEEF